MSVVKSPLTLEEDTFTKVYQEYAAKVEARLCVCAPPPSRVSDAGVGKVLRHVDVDTSKTAD